MPEFPLIAPRPPRLSAMSDDLRAIEERGIYSNGGPLARQFEREATDQLFGGKGEALVVSNATVGLMIAIRHGVGARCGAGQLALVPAMTFAATAQAALWAGLVPLIYDIDPATWAGDGAIEEALLERHGERVSAIVPYAPFGRVLDLDRYHWLSRRHGVAVIVDAAASLGTIAEDGLNFGAGAPMAVVYSMHATKTFATAEGGLIHSGNRQVIADLRRMTNFGFGASRSADLPGLNAKLPEHGALLASAKLAEVGMVCDHRARLADCYRTSLPEFAGQAPGPARQAFQFWSLLLPPECAPMRDAIIAALASDGIGSARYFSPHLGEQPLFHRTALIEPTPVSDDIARRLLSLPITDTMSEDDVRWIAERVRATIAASGKTMPHKTLPTEPAASRDKPFSTLLIGGGPAGTAMLTAATKQNRLAALAASGLAIVERSHSLGVGELGTYAIRSDSTAETFLSAIKDNVHESIAELVDHPAGIGMASHIGALGAPLTEAGDLLAVTGERLAGVVTDNGGTLLMGRSALSARRTSDGLWSTRLRREDGTIEDVRSSNIVIATGGYQCPDSVHEAKIAGSTLGELAGERLVTADVFMRLGGLDSARERLSGVRAPRIAIVGGSTSAVASAALLLKASPALPLGAGAVILLHRRPIRPFYHSREAALEEGFTDFTEADICPVSGFVYRLAGLRLESRELILRALSLGGREPDPRLALFRLDQHGDDEARAILTRADLVIGATGYRPHALPLFDETGAPIALACDSDPAGPMVDPHCRILAATGSPVSGAYGIGLAAGFVPWGPLGGEASFRGNANGLWLWQNDVGQMIVDQVLQPSLEVVT